jgi:hypothetical protein
MTSSRNYKKPYNNDTLFKDPFWCKRITNHRNKDQLGEVGPASDRDWEVRHPFFPKFCIEDRLGYSGVYKVIS